MSRKLLVVLLVVLAVLFVIAVGVGAARPTTLAEGPPDWIQSLGDRFVPKQALTAADISAAIPEECRHLLADNRLDMSQNSTCVLLIAETSAPVRTLSLQQLSGEVTVDMDSFAKNQSRVTLKPGADWPALQVFKEGGELRITCKSPFCKIEMEE